jgi:hypothetical protein
MPRIVVVVAFTQWSIEGLLVLAKCLQWVSRIRDAILVFNVLWLEGHLEPNCHFAFLNIP